MYKIVTQSTGIVVNQFINRNDALYWMEANNTDEKGRYLPLYRLETNRKRREGVKAGAGGVSVKD